VLCTKQAEHLPSASLSHDATPEQTSGTVATLISTFANWFATEPNPQLTLIALFDAFWADAAITPAQCFEQAEARTHPLPMLLAGRNGVPCLAITPFLEHRLPSVGGAPSKCAFADNVSPNGASPSLVTLAANCFHLTSAQGVVLPKGDVQAAWAAAPAGELHLPEQQL